MLNEDINSKYRGKLGGPNCAYKVLRIIESKDIIAFVVDFYGHFGKKESLVDLLVMVDLTIFGGLV